MKAVLIGSVSSTVATLRGMLRGGLPVAGVLGLHKRHAATVSDYCDLRPLAASAGIPFHAFDKVSEPGVREFIAAAAPDWLFVVGLSQLLPPELCAMVPAGAVGFHPTMLPEGRGRAPVAWTILLGRPAAANLFFLTAEPDAGDIIAQRPVPVLAEDYARDLIDRTNLVLEELVAELAPAFASGRVPRTPQDHSRATRYERRRPEDGRIEWKQPAPAIYRLVRAVSHPYPGAFTFRGQSKLLIWRARIVPGDEQGRPGALHAPGGPQPEGDAHSTAGVQPGVGVQSAGDAQRGTGGVQPLPGTIISVQRGVPIVQTASGLLALTDMEWESGPGAPLKVGEVLG